MARWPVVVIVPVMGLAACGTPAPPAANDGKLRVVATTTQLADFASVVGGDKVTVYGILKANVDPHEFEPSPADSNAISQAAVIAENGVGLEEWLDPVVKNAGTKATVVDTSEGVALRGGNDPHIWHNPLNAEVMCTNLERALEAADPANKATYQKNLADYQGQLDALDASISQSIGGLTNKKFVTNHDAFGYYVDRYGLDFVGSIIPSFDTSAELSSQDVSGIVAKIRASGAKAVFSESSLPPGTAQTIAEEAGVQVVAGPDSLYGDTLGPSGSDGATYLEMERHNTREIVDHLR